MKNAKWLSLVLSASLVVLGGCGAKSNTAAPDASKTPAANAPTKEKKVDFPKKPISLIVPASPGGGTDSTARALASSTEKFLGQSIGVVNKPGGSGAIGMSEGAHAKPDGYTVTMAFVELTTLNHLGLAPIKYQDFKPIALINLDPGAITVPKDAPYNTLKEFLDYAKKNPGKVKVGNSGIGSIWHLVAASIEKSADVKFQNVPFDGAGPAVTSLVGGHIDAVSVSPAEVLSQVKAGKLKTLAVMSDTRSAQMPDVPTFKEAGFDVQPLGTWRGLVVPKDTPDEIVGVLKDAFMKGASDENFKKVMNNMGLGLKTMDDKEFGKFMADNDERFGKLISELGLTKK